MQVDKRHGVFHTPASWGPQTQSALKTTRTSENPSPLALGGISATASFDAILNSDSAIGSGQNVFLHEFPSMENAESFKVARAVFQTPASGTPLETSTTPSFLADSKKKDAVRKIANFLRPLLGRNSGKEVTREILQQIANGTPIVRSSQYPNARLFPEFSDAAKLILSDGTFDELDQLDSDGSLKPEMKNGAFSLDNLLSVLGPESLIPSGGEPIYF